MRAPYIAGNWKMNTSRDEATALASAVKIMAESVSCDVAVCPPFPHLAPVGEVIAGSNVKLGAQDVHWESSGAFTGEVSPAMIAEYCEVVIIGHSERRQMFGETDETVRDKLAAVLVTSVNPIVCVGETLEQRKSGSANAVLASQLVNGLKGIALSDRITVAYEPIWAIGTGETATPETAQETCAFIRSELRKIDTAAAEAMRIQYGGSVNPANAATLLSQPDIDGALVGGAALKADQFGAILAAAG